MEKLKHKRKLQEKRRLQAEKAAEAKTMLNGLSEQPEFEVRARLELGRLHIDGEEYDDAIAALTPLLSTNVAKAQKSDEQAWDAYSNRKFSQLYGTYRIGWVAVETSQYTESGIDALNYYLAELEATDIDTHQLPSKNWANLRLAELFLNADDVSMASSTLDIVTKDGDKRLAKIMKSLKKQRRIQVIAVAVVALIAATALIGYALQDGINYFRSPSQVMEEPPVASEVFRIGGLVEEGALVRGEGETVRFSVTDGSEERSLGKEGI